MNVPQAPIEASTGTSMYRTAQHWGISGAPIALWGTFMRTQRRSERRGGEGAGGVGRYLRNLLYLRSARGLPSVWQVAQYCSDESAKLTSRTTSPQTGHG